MNFANIEEERMLLSRSAKVFKRFDTSRKNECDIPRAKMAKFSNVSAAVIHMKNEPIGVEEEQNLITDSTAQLSGNLEETQMDSRSLQKSSHLEETVKTENGELSNFEGAPGATEGDETENYIIILEEAFDNEADYSGDIIAMNDLQSNIVIILDGEHDDVSNAFGQAEGVGKEEEDVLMALIEDLPTVIENKEHNSELPPTSLKTESAVCYNSDLQAHADCDVVNGNASIEKMAENLLNVLKNLDQNSKSVGSNSQSHSNQPSVVNGKVSKEKVSRKTLHVLKNRKQKSQLPPKVNKRESEFSGENVIQSHSNRPSVVNGDVSKERIGGSPNVLKNCEQNSQLPPKVYKRESEVSAENDVQCHSNRPSVVSGNVSEEKTSRNPNVSSNREQNGKQPLTVVKTENEISVNDSQSPKCLPFISGSSSEEKRSEKPFSEQFYSCESCPYKSDEHNDYVQHLKIHQLLTQFKKNAEEEYLDCPYCPTTFKSEYELIVHISKHFSETLLTCPYCPITFRSPHVLKLHLSKHVLSVLIPSHNPDAPDEPESAPFIC